jgi:autotransporter-associated beta strand protein
MKLQKTINRHHLLGAVLAAASIPSLLAAPLDVIQEWGFNSDGNFENWTEFPYSGGEPVRITDLTVAGGVLSGKVSFNDPGLNVSGLSLNSTQAGYIRMRYRVLNGSSSPVIPASPAADLVVLTPGGNQGPATTAPNSNTLVDAVNGWTDAVWDLTDVTGTTITAIRLDPVTGLIDGGNGTFEIDYIQVLETDIQPQVAYEVDPAPLDPKYTLVKEWDSDADWALWAGTNFTINTISGGTITGTSSGTDAQLAISAANFGTAVPAPASGVFVVEFQITNNNANPGYQQLYGVDGTGGFVNGILATLTDTSTHVVRATLKDLFIGELRSLRLDPTRADGVVTSIDYIRVYVDPTQVGWDTNTVTTGAQGGSGTWNTSNPFFFDGFSGTNKAWPIVLANSTNHDAIFGASAGTVTVDAGGITANDLRFLTTGYTLTGGALNLNGATSVVSGASGVATTINAPINRTSSTATDLLNIAGPGTFTLGGGGTIDRLLHFKTNTLLSAGTFISSGVGNASNGLCIYNTSTLTLGGATLNRTNGDGDDALYVGNPSNTGDFAGSSRPGTFIVNSGTLAVSGGRGIAIGFGGSNNSVMTVNNGNVTSNSIFVGWNSSGTLNVAGGTVSVTPGDASASAVRHTDGGAGTINLTGGTLATGNVQLGIGAANAVIPLTVNLDGGTLETERIWISNATGATGTYTLTCNFDGGTLKLPAIAPTGSTGNILGDIINTGSGTAVFTTIIEDGGLVLDTNGRDTSINTVLEHDSTLGASPDGGLTKNGLGTLRLGATNTYTGITTVAAGILEVNGDAIPNTGKLDITGGKVLIPADTNEVVDTLFYNGVQQPIGVYGSTASGAANQNNTYFDVAGSGTLTVNSGPAAGYTAWAAINAGGQTADLDFDNDGVSNGVEYFMGETGSSFTPNPSVAAGTVTWPKDPGFLGTFKVQISDTLATGDWTDIVPPNASIDESNPNQIIFTLPTGDPKKFVRLSVTPAP